MQSKKYENEYHSSFHKNLINNSDYYLFRAKYADKEYWKYFSNVKNGKFIEFGCGIGQNIYLHKKNSIGIDISDFAIQQCQSKGIKAIKSIRDIDLSSVDGILCCHVLEHIEEPLKVLNEFNTLMKKKGILVLIVPYCYHDLEPADLRAGHLYAWTFSTLETLLHRAGFKVIKKEYRYAYGFSKVYKAPFRLAIKIIALLGRAYNRKEMVIVAEKP